ADGSTSLGQALEPVEVCTHASVDDPKQRPDVLHDPVRRVLDTHVNTSEGLTDPFEAHGPVVPRTRNALPRDPLRRCQFGDASDPLFRAPLYRCMPQDGVLTSLDDPVDAFHELREPLEIAEEQVSL